MFSRKPAPFHAVPAAFAALARLKRRDTVEALKPKASGTASAHPLVFSGGQARRGP